MKSRISNLKSEIPNPKSAIFNPKSAISNLKSEISNLKSSISNPVAPLPKGWRWVRLGEVVRRQSSNSKLIKGRLSFSPDTGLFPAYSASGQDVWCAPAGQNGTAIILSAVGARCGKCFLATGQWSAIANTHIIWPDESLCDPEFLWRMLNNEDFWIKDQAIQPFVQVGATLNKPIPLPPLSEQKRIAAILEEQLAAVDKARAAAQARLEAVKTLPAAFLRQVFPQPGALLPKGWRSVRLGEVCAIQNGFAFESDRFHLTAGVPLIRIRDLKTNQPSIKYNGEADQSYLVHAGDLLIGMDGEFRAYLWEGPGALLNQRVCRLFPETDRLNVGFLQYALDEYLREIEERTGFTTVKHISSRDIAGICIPLPPLAQQKRIAGMLREKLAAVDKARAAAEEELVTVNTLPASLLRRAFNGEL
ncbi:MAG: restriction endonuclease subunit S [Phycisphaerae bacterium]